MKNSFIISFIIHAFVVGTFVYWSLCSGAGIGGGEGYVEVSVLSGKSGQSGASASSMTKTTESIKTFYGNSFSSKTVENPNEIGAGAGEGKGVGSGSEKGDPRLIAIWKKINRSKYYPEMARKQKLEGAPKVTFRVSYEGKVEEARITETSGSEVLDKAALETIARSSPLPFYPKEITIAVRYALK